MKKIVAFALALTFPACVTMPRHRADLEIQQMKSDARFQLLLNQANVTIAALRERLVRFNQIDKEGNLIPLASELAPAK